MKEIRFLNQNIKKWQHFESLLDRKQEISADNIADLFIQVTDDLSYANTFYPGSKTSDYLNQLASKAHQHIYRNRKIKSGRLIRFWKTELPLLMYSVRKELFYAFLIFLVSTLIGVVSAQHDLSFVRIIMGDNYVNSTIDNIKKGNPMAVYNQMDETSMFLMITVNNIKVAFFAFVTGIFTAFGSGFILFRNGIMLGSFQYFFAEYDVFWESVRTIWIHGTLEISAIILAGCAGMVMGNSLIFPGTLPRKISLARGTRKGAKIILGIVPLFIVAGFLEGFVTRHTEMPLWLSILIIGSSLAFVIWYFILYPNQLANQPIQRNEVTH
jgi:uncharacterized membrane protein SpoIIM required for sporulation